VHTGGRRDTQESDVDLREDAVLLAQETAQSFLDHLRAAARTASASSRVGVLVDCGTEVPHSRSPFVTCGCAVVRCNRWTRYETRAVTNRAREITECASALVRDGEVFTFGAELGKWGGGWRLPTG
jgi:hypothetical protein